MARLRRVLSGPQGAPAPLSPTLSLATSSLVVISGLVAASFVSTGWQSLIVLTVFVLVGVLRHALAAQARRRYGFGETVELEIPSRVDVAIMVLAAGSAFAVGFMDPWLNEFAFGAWLGTFLGISMLLRDALRRRYWGRWVAARDHRSDYSA